MSELLRMEHISKRFGDFYANKDISLTVNRGEVLTLLGENGAGKSTLMNILIGLYQPTEGKIFLNGKEVRIESPSQAVKLGIGMVHQHFMLVEAMTVFENIILGDKHAKGLFIDRAARRKEIEELSAKYGLDVQLDKLITEISVGEQQRTEILKALYHGAELLILDEPSAALTDIEVEGLFAIMQKLIGEGKSIIFISHKMREVLHISDRITVLRLGEVVGTVARADTDGQKLANMMIGKELKDFYPKEEAVIGDTVLEVEDVYSGTLVKGASFKLRRGEILGLAGLVGAGRTELLETIFGVRTRAAGRVYFNNRLMNFSSAKEAMEHGFAMITEERKANGLFLKGDLTFNTTIANLEQYKSGVALSNAKMIKATGNEIRIMHTKCMGPDDMISSLSGGNQQKVIFGKWLEREPKVFMMDEPTRGIDVGAKYEIYELIINMAKQGKTIIVVSSEMPEILGITNRIGVMSNGRLSGIVNTKETNQEELLRLSAKYL